MDICFCHRPTSHQDLYHHYSLFVWYILNKFVRSGLGGLRTVPVAARTATEKDVEAHFGVKQVQKLTPPSDFPHFETYPVRNDIVWNPGLKSRSSHHNFKWSLLLSISNRASYEYGVVWVDDIEVGNIVGCLVLANFGFISVSFSVEFDILFSVSDWGLGSSALTSSTGDHWTIKLDCKFVYSFVIANNASNNISTNGTKI